MRRIRTLVALAIVPALLATLAATATLAGGRPLHASMSGPQEVPGPGDADGTGTARVWVNPGLGQVCFHLEVSNIAPATAAHIHFGAAGAFGGVAVGLAPPTNGTSSGCVDGVDRQLAKDILKHPWNYYVNVHNAEFAPGAVRGQLSK